MASLSVLQIMCLFRNFTANRSKDDSCWSLHCGCFAFFLVVLVSVDMTSLSYKPGRAMRSLSTGVHDIYCVGGGVIPFPCGMLV